MVEIGRLAIKTSGRDAGRECLVVDTVKDNLVLIDGNTRRRKCSLKHLELQPTVAKIKKGAEHAEVIKALKELGVEVPEKVEAGYTRKERSKKSKESKLKIFKKKEEKPAKKEAPKKAEKPAKESKAEKK